MDLIVFGRVFFEIVFGHVPALPGPGEEIFADELGFSCGGAVTVATAASRDGARAGLCTRLGGDIGSRFIEDHCRRERIDLSPSQRVPGRAPMTVVLNFDADRAFVTHPRPPHGRPGIGHWREVLRRWRPAWCYLHPVPGALEFLQEARSLGTRVALDVSLEEIAADPAHVLACAALADIFLPNEEEFGRLAGAGTFQAAADVAAAWGPCVVVKRGAQGAAVLGAAGVAEVGKGLQPVSVRDRTGAGDAFAGALVSAICRGAALTEAVAAGNAAGSAAVARLGGVGELEADDLTGAGRPGTPPSRDVAAAGHSVPGRASREERRGSHR